MTLTELEGRFVQLTRTDDAPETWSWHEVETLPEADGVMFLDPQGFAKNSGPCGTSSVICWFLGKVPDGLSPGPGRWNTAGNGIADLTLTPSVDLGPGRWHGHVTKGIIT